MADTDSPKGRMSWFRSVHGAPRHPKWRSLARKAGQPVPVVVAIAWDVMDYASRNDDRGSVAGYDCDDYAAYLDVDDEAVVSVIDAMTAKGWIVDGRVVSWEEHQVKREDGSAERGKAYRALKKAEEERDRLQAELDRARSDREQPPPDDIQPPANASERTRTHPNETERVEKRREDTDPSSLRSEGAGADLAEAMLEIYRAECVPPLADVRKLTDPRRKSALARLRADFSGDLKEWRAYCQRIRGSPHLTGHNDRNWFADFEWIINQNNCLKILEGRYDGRIVDIANGARGPRPGPGDSGFTGAIARAARRHDEMAG